MIPHFAETLASNPFGGFSGDQLLVWLAIAFAMMVMAEKGMGLWSRATGRSPLGGSPEQPVYHRTSEKPVNWAELGALERRVEVCEATMKALQSEITREFAVLRDEGEKRATRLMSAMAKSNGELHTKINGVVEGVAYMKGQMDLAASQGKKTQTQPN